MKNRAMHYAILYLDKNIAELKKLLSDENKHDDHGIQRKLLEELLREQQDDLQQFKIDMEY